MRTSLESTIRSVAPHAYSLAKRPNARCRCLLNHQQPPSPRSYGLTSALSLRAALCPFPGCLRHHRLHIFHPLNLPRDKGSGHLLESLQRLKNNGYSPRRNWPTPLQYKMACRPKRKWSCAQKASISSDKLESSSSFLSSPYPRLPSFSIAISCARVWWTGQGRRLCITL